MTGWKAFAAGDVLTASDVQQYLVNGPYVEFGRSTAQSINNNTATDLSWTVENSDREGLSSGTVTSFTIPATTGMDGVYLLSCYAQLDATSGTGINTLTIMVNGTGIAERRAANVSGMLASLSVTTTALLVAGDVVKAQIFHTSGSALNVNTNLSGPRFSLFRLSK